MTNPPKFRVDAVSYLNTVPLVWGMLHGPQREAVDLTFSIPSICARRVENDEVDIGLVPVAEIARQGLEIVPGAGIGCCGAVRSILLFSKRPWSKIRTLAADTSSRTSVQLARVILRERFSVEPETFESAPSLADMLAAADAALIIGDPALRIDPEAQTYAYLDLGAQWFELTRRPFVFAAWAGKPRIPVGAMSFITTGSYDYGRARLNDIVNAESEKRQVTRELARRYLTEHIRFELGPKEMEGLELFLALAGLKQEMRV